MLCPNANLLHPKFCASSKRALRLCHEHKKHGDFRLSPVASNSPSTRWNVTPLSLQNFSNICESDKYSIFLKRMCAAVIFILGLCFRLCAANNSSSASESLPPDRATSMWSPSASIVYSFSALLKRRSIFFLISCSSVNLGMRLVL